MEYKPKGTKKRKTQLPDDTMAKANALLSSMTDASGVMSSKPCRQKTHFIMTETRILKTQTKSEERENKVNEYALCSYIDAGIYNTHVLQNKIV